MIAGLWAVGLVVTLGALAYFRAPRVVWVGLLGAGLLAATLAGLLSPVARGVSWTLYVCASAIALFYPLRRAVLSEPLLGWFRRVMPQVSQTEQEALDAGTVWWDGDLFSGRPDWRKLFSLPKPALTAEEQAFLDGPAERLCAMVDEWKLSQELNDLPPEVWQFIKDNGFLGMIIPKQYGGLGFSALAHSSVIMKLATRTPTACVSVMVPNSLGPAELLLHYGTEAQKSYYLPRLAKGLEMPCFALTGPEAGSDAGSIPDIGVVCWGEHEGRRVLGMRVTWEKRYITLGPVATLLGLAFRLIDPEDLLGKGQEIGITVALIPTNHPGVHIGRRHNPLNASFMNGPNSGRDVFIPMDWVVGGQQYVGQGWRMLMESLAAGRSISLPASATGSAKIVALATGAYSRVRTQFKIAIGKFEGVEEALARIGGNTYLMEAARTMTAGAIDLGEKPSVISAIVKYHSTERVRQVVNDTMDIHGGKGICLGPSNYLGRAYQQVPIAITVEGANILTRSMIIFGQGAIRCHPYVLAEIAATREPDGVKAVNDFDAALCGHVSFMLGNVARALWSGLTGGRLLQVDGPRALQPHLKRLSRLSTAFALMSDFAMLFLGGDLKRREKISGRLADALSALYLGSCVAKRWHDDGEPVTDLPFVEWALQDCTHRAQEALFGVYENFPVRWAARLVQVLSFPFGRSYRAPADRLGHQIAALLMQASPTRTRLGAGAYLPEDENDFIGRLEVALRMVPEIEAIEAKLRSAMKSGALSHITPAQRVRAAQAQGILDAREAEVWQRYEGLRRACIMVDDFPHDFGRRPAAHDDRYHAKRRTGAAGRTDAPRHAGSEFERGEV